MCLCFPGPLQPCLPLQGHPADHHALCWGLLSDRSWRCVPLVSLRILPLPIRVVLSPSPRCSSLLSKEMRTRLHPFRTEQLALGEMVGVASFS